MRPHQFSDITSNLAQVRSPPQTRPLWASGWRIPQWEMLGTAQRDCAWSETGGRHSGSRLASSLSPRFSCPEFRGGRLNEGAESGDRLADDQVLHLIRAFVGIERLGICEEARNVVIDEDAVAAEQLSRPGNRLAHLGRGERLGKRRLLVGKLALVRELCCASHHALPRNGVAQHFGKKVLNELERADRLSELQALLCVLERVLVGAHLNP